jgi:hypothetical protein
MGEELVPRWGKVWSVGWVLLIGACATPSGEPEPSASAAASVGRTEQVIQRVMPASDEAQRAGARTNASESSAASSPSRDTRSARGGISSKHIEAELNRLEAELRR